MVDITRISSLNNLNGTTGRRIQTGDPVAPGTNSPTLSRAEELQSQFLNLLLTQLQNQNPMDPMDTKEFASQLTQYSSLEQQINTNSKLDSLLETARTSSSSAAFGYIGQTAELDSRMTVLEDNSADWKYALNTPADRMTIKIKDEQGRVVYEREERNVQSGTYTLNAKQEDFLFPVADGAVLTLEITGKDRLDQDLRTQISTSVTVDGVETGPNGIDLRAGGLIFSIGDVRKFRNTSPPAAA
jgi:flagellar basal-body rod modification protein FlgD